MDEKRKIEKLINVKNNKQNFASGVKVTNNMNAYFEEVQKEFWSSVFASGKCPHCNKSSNSIRKEGCSKFFISTNDESQNLIKLGKKSQKDKQDNSEEESGSEMEQEE